MAENGKEKRAQGREEKSGGANTRVGGGGGCLFAGNGTYQSFLRKGSGSRWEESGKEEEGCRLSGGKKGRIP